MQKFPATLTADMSATEVIACGKGQQIISERIFPSLLSAVETCLAQALWPQKQKLILLSAWDWRKTVAPVFLSQVIHCSFPSPPIALSEVVAVEFLHLKLFALPHNSASVILGAW